METVRARARKRTVLLLLAVFGVLLAVFLITMPSQEEEADDARPLLTVAPEDIRQILISAPGRPTIRLERAGEGWALVEPLEARADSEAVAAIVEVSENIIGTPLFAEPPEDLSAYGLDRDSGVGFAVIDHAGNREEIVLGKTIPLDVGYVYTLDPSSGRVFQVYKDVKGAVDQTVFDLRDKSVAHIDPADMRTIEIVQSSGRVVLQRRGDWWRIEEPFEAPAGTQAVSRLLSSLSGLKAQEFPTEVPESASSAEGGDSVFTTTVHLSDGEGESFSVQLGPTYGNDLRIVSTGSSQHLYGVQADALEGLPLSPDLLIARTPLRFLPEDIVRVSVEREEESFELKKADGDWRIVAPEEQRAVDSSVSYALGVLSELQVTDPPSGAVSGPDPVDDADVHIVLFEDDGTEHEMWLAGVDEDAEQGATTLMGASSFRDEPFGVDSASLSGIPLSAAGVADRRLLFLSGKDIGAFEIRTGEGTIRLEKRDNDWMLSKPRSGRAKQPTAWGVVFALEKLKYQSVLEERGNAETLRRREPDALTVELWSEEGESVGIVTLAPTDTDTRTARAATMSREGILEVDASVLEQIPTRAEDIEFRR